MRLVFLGTSAALPTLQRNASALALDLAPEKTGVWLFDCGEATQHQLLRSDLKLSKIAKIFISHMHGDHLFGLVPLLCSMALQGRRNELVVYGPPGLKKYITCCLAGSYSFLTFPLKCYEIQDREVCHDSQFNVTAYEQQHRCPSFAYRLEEKKTARALISEKITALHRQPGPWLAQLKAGRDVVLPNGRILTAAEFTTAATKGKVITIFGDTAVNANQIAAAKEADVVVHEATYRADLADKAQRYGHCTSRQVAEMALAAGVKKLIITHISSRYSPTQAQQLLAECRQIFAASFLAADLAQFVV